MVELLKKCTNMKINLILYQCIHTCVGKNENFCRQCTQFLWLPPGERTRSGLRSASAPGSVSLKAV